MKFKGCALNIDAVVSNPLLRKSPEKPWLSAYKRIFHFLTDVFKIKKDYCCDISLNTYRNIIAIMYKYKFKHF